MIYLDNAATSWPKPPGVIQAVENAMALPLGNPGRTHHRSVLAAAELVSACRENLAHLFGVSNPLRICLTSNTTEALNLAIKGTLAPGDHAICSSMEHNSVWRPLTALTQRGVELSIAQADATGFVTPESVQHLLRPNTKLVAVMHASNVSGTIQPIAEIGQIVRRHGALMLVDAAQSAGLLPIDVEAMSIDLLAFPGHKGLLGPQGTGGLYVREGIELSPLKEGGTGSESLSPMQPAFYPDRMESGTLNLPGIAGLGAAVSYLIKEGVENIAAVESALTMRLVKGLSALDGVTVYGPGPEKSRVPVVSFNVVGWESTDVAEELERQAGIASRPGIHCAGLAHKTLQTQTTGTVRLSPGPFNTEEHIDAALLAIEKIQASHSGFSG